MSDVDNGGQEEGVERRLAALEAMAHEPQAIPVGNIMARLEALERRGSTGAPSPSLDALLDEFESACLTYAGGPESKKEGQAERMVRARKALVAYLTPRAAPVVQEARMTQSSEAGTYGFDQPDPRHLTLCLHVPCCKFRPCAPGSNGCRCGALEYEHKAPVVDLRSQLP